LPPRFSFKGEPWKGNGNVVDREHVSAIADSARATLQSLNAFIKAKRAGAILLSDELLHEFIVRWRALRQRMIDAGCFGQHRLAVAPLEGKVHAALLTLAADIGADDRLPPEIEVSASRLAEVVPALEEFLVADTNAKGTPGRRGYPLKALGFAKELRAKNPKMKLVEIRNKCLKCFSEDDLPPDLDSFRRWLNRKRAKRAN
jgi:hypothetical protein